MTECLVRNWHHHHVATSKNNMLLSWDTIWWQAYSTVPQQVQTLCHIVSLSLLQQLNLIPSFLSTVCLWCQFSWHPSLLWDHQVVWLMASNQTMSSLEFDCLTFLLSDRAILAGIYLPSLSESQNLPTFCQCMGCITLSTAEVWIFQELIEYVYDGRHPVSTEKLIKHSLYSVRLVWVVRLEEPQTP